MPTKVDLETIKYFNFTSKDAFKPVIRSIDLDKYGIAFTGKLTFMGGN